MVEKIKLTDSLRADAQAKEMRISDYIASTYADIIAEKVKENPALAKLSPLAIAMRDLGITGNTKIKDLVTTQGAPDWLLPAYMSQIMISPEDGSEGVLSYLRSTPINVNSLSINAPYVDFKNNAANKSAVTRRRVAEGADIPVGVISVGENAVRLYKSGRGIEQTYESIMYFTLELVALALRRIALDYSKAKVDDAVDVLINGDGNDNAITAFSAATAGANVITATELTNYCISFWEDTGLMVDTIVAPSGFYKSIFGLQYDTANGFGASSKLTFNTPQFDLTKCTLIQAAVPANSSSKNRIILANKALALKEYVSEGSVINEVATNIRNQTKLATFSEISGFALFDKTARKAIVSA